MKNFLNDLAKHGISAQNIDDVAACLQQRASGNGFAHPLSVYQSLAIDLALGAIDTEQETAANLDNTHSAKQWLALITGRVLTD